MKDIILIIGNPGTGKSTTANCLAGQVLFDANVSYGRGLTFELSERECDGITYMDTPGLADPELEKAAAAAITTALQRTGSYRIFFTVRLQNGRVVQEDIMTMQRVMGSIHIKHTLMFAVIINHVEDEDYTHLVEGADFCQEDRDRVLAQVNAGSITTPNIFFLRKIPALNRKKNVVMQLPSDFLEFVRNAPPIVIESKENISDVTTDEEEKLELRAAIAAKTREVDDAKAAAEHMVRVMALQLEESRAAAASREAELLLQAQLEKAAAEQKANEQAKQAKEAAAAASKAAAENLAKVKADAENAAEAARKKAAEVIAKLKKADADRDANKAANDLAKRNEKAARAAEAAATKAAEEITRLRAEAEKAAEVEARQTKAVAAHRLLSARAEAKRLKDSYGAGVSVQFVISNDSVKHSLYKLGAQIDSGKGLDDCLVKFPGEVAPYCSEAGFHGKKSGSMAGSAGHIVYKINDAELKIKWEHPYWTGEFSSSVTVSGSNFSVIQEATGKTSSNAVLHVTITDAP